MPQLFPGLEEEFREVARLLVDAPSVAVVAHIKPDADAVGSACALTAGLRQLGVQARAYIGQDFPHPENLASVPLVDEITYTCEPPAEALIVTVDCASPDRTGAFDEAIIEDPERVVVIDHHASNPRFGATNLVVASESTTAMIRELLTHMGVELDRDIAYCLYAGLVTDTGNFRWGTPRMHQIAAELMSFGLNTRQIAMDLMDAMTPADMRDVGLVLAGMEAFESAGTTVTVFTVDAQLIESMSQTAVECIIDYARSVQGSDIGVVLKQHGPRYWNVSLRSASADVSRVAARLGGGGHVPAAGYSARGSREEVVSDLLSAL
ncbi:bifunctional oligoribonuclease/PAP phosphatase NrnA [Corynebacterium qintianiae]|uniref:Bifunctional oligoribonuclease/PAP phosphatase NrnA n=1 Tax=Corynebacterium qintianiae TaxID=2709392 RepID=A0A7T0KL79_9CORY|nr:bifunctional oligoribonuclease/PAP phosphatase NrnA [Corynebacterium qintianiae]QPK82567.1 bifunctional oligoribonuclease/PAP phosphatase NrnA [Corynebacterium qintianiae]